MSCAEQFLEQKMHPTVIISAFRKALDDMQDILASLRYEGSQYYVMFKHDATILKIKFCFSNNKIE